MTPELQNYYEQRLAMMGSPAWAELVEDVRRMIEATDTLSGVETEKALWFRKGELSIMNWLIAQKEMTEQAYEDLNAPAT